MNLKEFKAAVISGLPPFSTWAWNPYIILCWQWEKTVEWTIGQIREAADFEIKSNKNK